MPGVEPWWHIAGLAVVFLLIAFRRWARTSNIAIIFIASLVSVFLHELCHALVGSVLMAGLTGISLIPKRNYQDGGWTLGSVEFNRITAFNAVPIAFAPLLLPVLAYELIRFWPALFPVPSLSSTVGMYSAAFVLLYDCLPSRQDLRICCNWKSVLLYGSGIGVYIVWKMQGVTI